MSGHSCPACTGYPTDVQARITDGGNKHFAELTRIRHAEAIGKPIAQTMTPAGVWTPDLAVWETDWAAP